nr:PREDICTED: mast cell protease 1A-like isoform X2 [Latimeria chalumnae]|eukprot:XP_005996400.2 PREDICTED: mast cell protease 1A-like isoform X2 [Latimeria chalumnae]
MIYGTKSKRKEKIQPQNMSSLHLFLLLLSVTSAVHFHDWIIGGKEAKPHSRPYMAYLKVAVGNRTKRCGGFLVRDNFVMTAAHCNGITVLLGVHDLEEPEDDTRQTFTVKTYHVHPKFYAVNLSNDIMLLELDKRATLNNVVNTIKLPVKYEADIAPQTMCSVAGWGTMADNNLSEKLNEVNLTVISRKECRKYFLESRSITKQVICAGDPADNKLSYRGDSGGPLVCNDVAEGIVSCGLQIPRPPGIYTRIANYICWINKIITQSK